MAETSAYEPQIGDRIRLTYTPDGLIGPGDDHTPEGVVVLVDGDMFDFWPDDRPAEDIWTVCLGHIGPELAVDVLAPAGPLVAVGATVPDTATVTGYLAIIDEYLENGSGYDEATVGAALRLHDHFAGIRIVTGRAGLAAVADLVRAGLERGIINP